MEGLHGPSVKIPYSDIRACVQTVFLCHMLEGPCIFGLDQGFVYMSHLETSERLQSGDPIRVSPCEESEDLSNVSANILSESPGTPLRSLWGLFPFF